jgi:phosphopantothenoylcysteine decarboxylase/phosphopantothenate--cysteine ligase
VGHRQLDVLVGITGGVAAYRGCELIRLFIRDGRRVRVVATPAALRFVGTATLEGLSREPLLSDRPSSTSVYPHLEASRHARVMCIAPCSANTLAKLAHGIADNVLLESALALAGRLVVAPAMNVGMWRHPATQANATLLSERGVSLVGPDDGQLAEGEQGPGRMAMPDAIASVVNQLLGGTGGLAGRRVLVTAGGTREPLDPVRFIGNRSSGRMGVAVADEAAARGAQVTTLISHTLVRPRAGLVVETPTAADLAREALTRAPDADVVVMAAAVADFTLAEPATTKKPRQGRLVLELESTTDILAAIAANRRPGQVLIGFAAETTDVTDRARAKLERKHLDLVVANDVSSVDVGFDAADNEVWLVSADSVEHVPRAPKPQIARVILDRVQEQLAAAAPAEQP